MKTEICGRQESVEAQEESATAAPGHRSDDAHCTNAGRTF
jgi:hypothetical protein